MDIANDGETTQVPVLGRLGCFVAVAPRKGARKDVTSRAVKYIP